MDLPLESASSLISQHKSLSSLSSVANWRVSAESNIAKLCSYAEDAKHIAETSIRRAVELRQEVKKASLWGIFFKSAEEKKLAKEITSLNSKIRSCSSLAEKLQERIDSTPSNDQEKSIMLKELKAQKKELLLEKKELNAQMKEVRTVARQRSANAPMSFTSLVGGSKYTAAQRRDIRMQKERLLAPQEDTKTAIERNILAIEREILRIESFN